MMKIFRSILIILVLVELTGCAANYSKQQILAAGSQVQVRSYQTRTYDTNDKIRVLRSVMSTLQDLGFVIDKADDVIGIVSATKLDRYNLSMSISVRPSGQQMIVRANAQYNLTAVEEPGPYQDFFTSLDKGLFLDDNLLANSKSTQNIRVEASKNLADDIGEDAFAFYGQAEKEITSGTYDANLWARAFVLVEGDEQKRKAKYIELRAYQLYNENTATTVVKKQTSPVAKSILPVTVGDDSTLTAAKMRELISGNTLSGQTEEGTNFHEFHDSDGTIKGKAQGGYYDSGTWEITTRGDFCQQWEKWWDGNRDCYRMHALGDNKYRLVEFGKSNGSLFVIQKGDQRNSDYLSDSILHGEVASGIDLTGTWVSEITSSNSYNFRGEDSKLVITIEQNGNIVTGTDSSGKAEINGIQVGDTIKFDFWLGRVSSTVLSGQWKISADGSKLEGSWETSTGSSSGKWNLTKIQ